MIGEILDTVVNDTKFFPLASAEKFLAQLRCLKNERDHFISQLQPHIISYNISGHKLRIKRIKYYRMYTKNRKNSQRGLINLT